MKKDNKRDKVFVTLARGPKRGLTALEIAERTGLNLATVRSYLYGMRAVGQALVVGKLETKRKGRPALRYAASDTTRC